MRRRLIALTLTLGMCALVFYGGMDWAARFETDRNAFSPSARNSIQHAFVAAETYATLRSFWLLAGSVSR